MDEDKNVGVINHKGEIKVPFEFESVSIVNTKHELIAAKKNGRYGIINFQQEIILDFEYSWDIEIKNDWIKVKKNGFYGGVSLDGKPIIPTKFQSIGYFSDGRASCKLYGRKG